MKTIRRFTVAAAFLLILLAMCAASAENLLENPDFLHLDEEEMPVGWYTDAYIMEPGYTVFKFEGDAEHRAAVSIQNIGENDARFAQTVNVEPDSIYLLSGYVRAEDVEGGHGANLSIDGIYAFSDKYYDTDGKKPGSRIFPLSRWTAFPATALPTSGTCLIPNGAIPAKRMKITALRELSIPGCC